MLQDFLYDIVKKDFKCDENEFKKDIRESVDEDKFEWLWNNNNCIGFYTWLEKFKDKRRFIYIGNFFIYKKYRGFMNISIFRKEFRNKFKNIEKFYWLSHKKNKFIYISGGTNVH